MDGSLADGADVDGPIFDTTAESESEEVKKEKKGRAKREKIQAKFRREIAEALKERQDFRKVAKQATTTYQSRISDAYGGENVKLNIYWSYIQSIKKVTFARLPVPVIRAYEGHNDDKVVSFAESLIERNARYWIRCPDMKVKSRADAAVFDLLTAGAGVLWPRYEFRGSKEVVQLEPGEKPEDYDVSEYSEYEDGTKEVEIETDSPEYEAIHLDYVNYADYLESVSRTDDEVRWKAKRAYMTRSQVKSEMGEDVYEEVKHLFDGRDVRELSDSTDQSSYRRNMRTKLPVWELHNKPDRKVYYIATSAEVPLKIADDFNKLENFFPVPEAMKAARVNDSTIPVSEYRAYAHLIDKINELSKRRSFLTKGLKIAGVYNKGIVDLKDMFNQMNTSMIPASDWREFAKEGGFDGNVQWIPIEQFAKGIEICSASIDKYKVEFYEVSGFTATMRDQVEASKPSAAIQQAAHFTNLRNSDRQEEVQRFFRDITSIVAEMVCNHSTIETILAIAGEYPDSPEDIQKVEAAEKLIRSTKRREISVEITTDSTIAVDQTQEKRDRIEFANMASNFLQQVLQLIEKSPAFVPASVEMFLFVLDSFRVGRPVEEKLMDGLQEFIAEREQQKKQGPPPNPEMIKIQQQAESDKMKIQAEQQKSMAEAEQARMDGMMKFEGKMEEIAIHNQQFQQKQQQEMQLKSMDLQFKYQDLMMKLQAQAQKDDKGIAAEQMNALKAAEAELQKAMISAEVEISKEQLKAETQERIERIKNLADVSKHFEELGSKEIIEGAKLEVQSVRDMGKDSAG